MNEGFDFDGSNRKFDIDRYTFPSLKILNQEHSELLSGIPGTDSIISLKDNLPENTFDVIQAADNLLPIKTNMRLQN